MGKGLKGEPGIHITYPHKDPNDPRRNKKWCVYYCSGFCEKKNMNCVGSSYCMEYSEQDESTTKNLGSGIGPKHRETRRQPKNVIEITVPNQESINLKESEKYNSKKFQDDLKDYLKKIK